MTNAIQGKVLTKIKVAAVPMNNDKRAVLPRCS